MRYLFFCLTGLIFISGFYFRQQQLRTLPYYPTDIQETSNNLYLVSNKGLKTVVLYSAEFDKPLLTREFEEIPTGIATRGDYAYITTFETVGKVHFLNLITGEVEKSLITGSGANSPVISPEGNTLYVLNQFQNTVTRIDLNTRKIIGTAEVLREPKGAVVCPEGKYLFVTNFLPAQRADIDTVAASVSVMDLDGFVKVKDIQLPGGSNALRDICLSPDGRYVLIVHNLGRFGLPTNQLLQGWMNTSAMSMIDVETLEKSGTVLLDDPERGAAGIWGINCTDDKIVITHSGTHEISVIDYPAFLEKFNTRADKSSLNYDLTFMSGIRHRINLIGNGPRNFIISGDNVIIPTYFSDILNIVDLSDNQVRFIHLNENRTESETDRGKRVFNDAAYCFQNWQSCNGCHPGEGRTDGLNWDLLNDGVGNPKNTKSLLYSHVTPPVMISGIRVTAEIAVRAGFRHIQFNEISEDLAMSVDEYLKSLRPVPSPYLVNGKLSGKAERGKLVYQRLGCGDCHSGTYFTDLKMYRIGQDIEFEKGWDTPTLNEVWRTAPYLFDGRAATMEDVFKIHRHGIEEEISDIEVDELVEYVNSL